MPRVDIKGPIVGDDDLWIYEWFGIEAVSPNKVAEQLKAANGETVDVYINSPGGYVDAGSEIYAMIKEYPDSIGKIVGIAASAASLVAMGTKRLLIAPPAQIMIHNVASGIYGDFRAHQHEADVLKNYNISITNAYRLKTGMPEDELLRLVNEETWLNAQQALEMKFVDGIMFDEQGALKLTASFGSGQLLPQYVIDKVRNELLAKRGGDPSTKTAPPIEQPPEAKRTHRVPLSLYAKKLALHERMMGK